MNYQFNSYVTRKEAEELKDIIFRRARERSQAMTDDVQADVMSIARESFVSNNPFAQILNGAQAVVNQSQSTQGVSSEPEVSALHEYVDAVEEMSEEVGFPQREIPAGAENQNRIIQEQASARQIQDTMREAREGLSAKKSFMGALEFLNSQAAVSLLNKRSVGVDIVA